MLRRMAMVMKVEPGGTVYNLPPESDLDQLKQTLAEGIARGAAIGVTVDMKDDPTVPAEVFLNGKTITSVLIFDVAAEAGQEPVFDQA